MKGQTPFALVLTTAFALLGIGGTAFWNLDNKLEASQDRDTLASATLAVHTSEIQALKDNNTWMVQTLYEIARSQGAKVPPPPGIRSVATSTTFMTQLDAN